MCTVTPDDGDASGAPMSASLVVENMSPSVSLVSVTAATDADGDNNANTGVASDVLACSYVFTDLDGQSDNSTVAWTVGGVAVGTGTSLAAGFVKGDTVTCTVTPFDGLTTGAAVSASLVVGNQAPAVSGVSVRSTTDEDQDSNHATAVASDSLTCGYTYTDSDGDADNSTVEWMVNGSPVTGGLTLAGAFAKGDVVSCAVTANDGALVGNTVSATLTVGNTMPSVTNVAIAPNPADASDTLSCSYTFADVDGDADSSQVSWSVNGVAAGTGASLSGALARATP